MKKVDVKIEKEGFPNVQLPGCVQVLAQLSTMNPISFEISRAHKKFDAVSTEYQEAEKELLNEYVVVDEKGNFELKKTTAAKIEDAQKKGFNVAPTIEGFVMKDDSKFEEFSKKHKELRSTKVEVKVMAVNAKTKIVSVEGEGQKPLLEVLSKYFTSGQILSLEDMGILTNLDD